MNWEAIGALGEIIGAIAVVSTLWYLAAQMKTNTSAVNQAARQATLLGRSESTRWVAGDPELNKLLWNGAANPEQLSEDELQRFVLIVAGIIRPVELAFIDYQEGRMSSALWESQKQTVLFWFSQPGFDVFLEKYGQTLYPEFVTYIHKVVGKRGAA